jgi:hypothetical protein
MDGAREHESELCRDVGFRIGEVFWSGCGVHAPIDEDGGKDEEEN